MAGQCISQEVTVKDFNQCCISSAVGGTDGNKFWNGSVEDGKVRSQCEEGESTDCEDEESDADCCRQIEPDMVCVFSV